MNTTYDYQNASRNQSDEEIEVEETEAPVATEQVEETEQPVATEQAEETENPDTEAPKQNSDGGAVKAEVKKSSGTQQTVTSASRSAAKTGDSAQPELYLILLLIAAGGIGLIAWRRRYDKDGSV